MARNTAGIITALNDRLVSFSAGAYVTKTAFEGQKFKGDKNAIWFRQKTLWAPPVMIGAFTEGTYREQGIYQISVMIPNSEGIVVGSAVLDDLMDHFKRGTELTSGGITVKVEKCYRSTSIEEPTWVHVPVNVEFWAYSAYGS